MITKVEVERFNLISSRPFDKILAAIKAAIGHPDMVAFAKRTAAAPTFTEFESIVVLVLKHLIYRVLSVQLSVSCALPFIAMDLRFRHVRRTP